ncbi:carboxypeptidase B-like [Ptychodera flava]|uniref:carboxypeptidase B-like n=1 Tax=Ptychodera flava TaxID=63121 RepID=UPI00396A5B32
MWKILVSLLSLALVEAVTRYDGYKVLRVVPNGDAQVRYLRNLEEDLELSFWKEASFPGRPVDIMVPPNKFGRFKTELRLFGFDVNTMMTDVQSVIDRQMEENAEKRSMNPDSFDYNTYHTYDEIDAWIDEISAANHDIASPFTVGTSYEGRKIRGVKVGKQATGKKAQYYVGGIHAREWVSPSTMIYTVKYLVEGYGNDPSITNYLDNFDYYIVPSSNPDGYEFTWTTDRMWRKTRSPNAGSNCVGTDPNRNWSAGWGRFPGSSGNPCSTSYRGPEAFSEAETDAAAKFVESLAPNVAVFIDFHAYSQMWMSPYGYTRDSPPEPDYTKQIDANKRCGEAIEAVHGKVYQTGTIANTIYVANGNTADWGYDNQNILLSHAVELRDTGEHGFLLPEDQIQPTAEETFEAVKEISKIALENMQ